MSTPTIKNHQQSTIGTPISSRQHKQQLNPTEATKPPTYKPRSTDPKEMLVVAATDLNDGFGGGGRFRWWWWRRRGFRERVAGLCWATGSRFTTKKNKPPKYSNQKTPPK